LATNTSGGIEWQARYKPFGETRWTSGTLTTNRKPALSEANGFNGMKEEVSLGGIYDFNARFYDPAIGRFLCADTVVPRPSDPQSLNRFAFVRNNPLKYVDPSGHAETCAMDSGNGCGGSYLNAPEDESIVTPYSEQVSEVVRKTYRYFYKREMESFGQTWRGKAAVANRLAQAYADIADGDSNRANMNFSIAETLRNGALKCWAVSGCDYGTINFSPGFIGASATATKNGTIYLSLGLGIGVLPSVSLSEGRIEGDTNAHSYLKGVSGGYTDGGGGYFGGQKSWSYNSTPSSWSSKGFVSESAQELGTPTILPSLTVASYTFARLDERGITFMNLGGDDVFSFEL
jgi:RHS repeat-associated protein